MATVSNTTPLRYLIAVRQAHLLEALFGRIYIPNAVFEELTHARSPDSLKKFFSAPPGWLEVCAVKDPGEHPLSPPLHRGEREALALAELLGATLLLMDEKNGRRAAMRRNLKVSGTLGILEAADSLRLLDGFPDVLEELKASGFYLKPPLEQLLLQRHNLRMRRE
jgi:predicted nucleic acid-binding protein